MNSYSVDRSHWAKSSIFEQMGNIYSEVGRSFALQRRHDTPAAEAAMVRALDLFDATTEVLIAQKSVRAKEVLRARDQYLEIFLDTSDNDEAVRGLENYFMHFAVAARRGA